MPRWKRGGGVIWEEVNHLQWNASHSGEKVAFLENSQELCVGHLVASKTMWVWLYYYEPSATCDGLLVVNMLHLSGLVSFDFIWDVVFKLYYFFLAVIFVTKNYWLVFDYFGCPETRNSVFFFSCNLTTNLTLENSIFHKEVSEGSFITRRGSFPFKKTFWPCAPTCPFCHTKITELAPLELLTHFAKLTPTKYHILPPII